VFLVVIATPQDNQSVVCAKQEPLQTERMVQCPALPVLLVTTLLAPALGTVLRALPATLLITPGVKTATPAQLEPSQTPTLLSPVLTAVQGVIQTRVLLSATCVDQAVSPPTLVQVPVTCARLGPVLTVLSEELKPARIV